MTDQSPSGWNVECCRRFFSTWLKRRLFTEHSNLAVNSFFALFIWRENSACIKQNLVHKFLLLMKEKLSFFDESKKIPRSPQFCLSASQKHLRASTFLLLTDQISVIA